MPDTAAIVDDAIASRRSVRAFLPTPVPQATIQHLLDVYHRLGTQVEPRQRPWLVLASSSQPADLARDFVRLSPALRLVSGEAGDLGQLAKLLGEPPHPERDSRATLYLIAPNAKVLAFFPASQAAQAVTADLTLLAAWPLDSLENLSHE